MIYYITGPIQSGKTTLLLKYTQNKPNIGGFLTPIGSDNLKKIYNIQSKTFHDFATTQKSINSLEVGRYHLLQETFIDFTEIVKLHMTDKSINTIIIDEFGKLELNQKGFYSLIPLIIDYSKSNTVILVIRDSLLNEFKSFFYLLDINLKEFES